MAIIDDLCVLPAGDVNYQSALLKATKAQLKLAVQIMHLNPKNHQTRIGACEKRIKELEESEPVTEVKVKTSKTESKKTTSKTASKEKKKDEPLKVVAFPSPKPKIKTLPKSDEHHTIEEVRAKLDEALKRFTDSDDQFVIKGLYEKCAEDEDFRNNFMRKDKTYNGFHQYMFNAAMKGYCIKIGNVGGVLSKEKALDLAFDYFNMSEIIKPEEKKEVAKKLTEEVNKIAEEANEESDDGFIKETDGQLKFDF